MRKKALVLSLLAVLLCFSLATSSALAAEKIVQVLLPDCGWEFTADRVSSILQTTPGVKKYNVNMFSHIVTFVFDNEKVPLETIIKNLEKGGFPLEGSPKYLDKF
jgi:copper chaperone CopZ